MGASEIRLDQGDDRHPQLVLRAARFQDAGAHERNSSGGDHYLQPDQPQCLLLIGCKVLLYGRHQARSGRLVSARQRPLRAFSHVRTAHLRNGRSPIRLRGLGRVVGAADPRTGYSPYSCPLARQTNGRGRTIPSHPMLGAWYQLCSAGQGVSRTHFLLNTRVCAD